MIASRYNYEPFRHLPRPAPTLAGPPLSRGCRPRAPRQPSLVPPRFSPHVLPPLPRWDRRVRISLASPAASAFPVCVAGRRPRRRFQACSGFTRVAARAVRCPPEEVFSPDASGHSSPPDPSGVLPAGARAAGWGSNPPNRGTFGQGTHTNTVERAIRPISLGRKNALFAGSDGGACHWAIVASLVATAKLNGVEPLAWLTDVLERTVSGRTKAHELERLLPWAWKAERLTGAADA